MIDSSDLPVIDRVEVDPAALASFSDEDDFTGLDVSLLVEAASYLTVASNILDQQAGWNRENAVIGGLAVRLVKLISGLLDQVCQRRAEIAQIMCRLVFETIVDIRYLVRHKNPELVEDFIRSSFRQERVLRDQILERVAQRCGELLPIEDRMLKSINHAATLAGITLDDVSPKARNWGGKHTRDKAKDIFGDDLAYVGAFILMSQAIHGGWGDLMQFHLETEDGERFTPSPEWTHPRPQLLTTAAFLTVDAVLDVLGCWDEGLRAHYEPALIDLQHRIKSSAIGHEAYLAKKVWPTIR